MEVEKLEEFSRDELRRHLYSSLRSTGVLDSIKGQLRARLLEHLRQQHGNSIEPNIKRREPTLTERLLSSLFLDYLEKNGFTFTISVFMPESRMSSWSPFKYEEMLELLHLDPSSKLFRRLKLVGEGKECLAHQLVMVLQQIAKECGIQEVSTQTSQPEACQRPTQIFCTSPKELERSIKEVEDAYIRKKEAHDAQRMLPYSSSEDKITVSHQEFDARVNAEVAYQVSRIRDYEISAARMEEAARYRRQLARDREELEEIHKLRMDRIKAREESLLQRMLSKEKAIEASAYEQRQKILTEITSLRERENKQRQFKEAQERREEKLNEKELSIRVKEEEVVRVRKTLYAQADEIAASRRKELEEQYRELLDRLHHDQTLLGAEREQMKEERVGMAIELAAARSDKELIQALHRRLSIEEDQRLTFVKSIRELEEKLKQQIPVAPAVVNVPDQRLEKQLREVQAELKEELLQRQAIETANLILERKLKQKKVELATARSPQGEWITEQKTLMATIHQQEAELQKKERKLQHMETERENLTTRHKQLLLKIDHLETLVRNAIEEKVHTIHDLEELQVQLMSKKKELLETTTLLRKAQQALEAERLEHFTLRSHMNAVFPSFRTELENLAPQREGDPHDKHAPQHSIDVSDCNSGVDKAFREKPDSFQKKPKRDSREVWTQLLSNTTATKDSLGPELCYMPREFPLITTTARPLSPGSDQHSRELRDNGSVKESEWEPHWLRKPGELLASSYGTELTPEEGIGTRMRYYTSEAEGSRPLKLCLQAPPENFLSKNICVKTDGEARSCNLSDKNGGKVLAIDELSTLQAVVAIVGNNQGHLKGTEDHGSSAKSRCSWDQENHVEHSDQDGDLSLGRIYLGEVRRPVSWSTGQREVLVGNVQDTTMVTKIEDIRDDIDNYFCSSRKESKGSSETRQYSDPVHSPKMPRWNKTCIQGRKETKKERGQMKPSSSLQGIAMAIEIQHARDMIESDSPGEEVKNLRNQEKFGTHVYEDAASNLKSAFPGLKKEALAEAGYKESSALDLITGMRENNNFENGNCGERLAGLCNREVLDAYRHMDKYILSWNRSFSKDEDHTTWDDSRKQLQASAHDNTITSETAANMYTNDDDKSDAESKHAWDVERCSNYRQLEVKANPYWTRTHIELQEVASGDDEESSIVHSITLATGTCDNMKGQEISRQGAETSWTTPKYDKDLQDITTDCRRPCPGEQNEGTINDGEIEQCLRRDSSVSTSATRTKAKLKSSAICTQIGDLTLISRTHMPQFDICSKNVPQTTFGSPTEEIYSNSAITANNVRVQELPSKDVDLMTGKYLKFAEQVVDDRIHGKFGMASYEPEVDEGDLDVHSTKDTESDEAGETQSIVNIHTLVSKTGLRGARSADELKKLTNDVNEALDVISIVPSMTTEETICISSRNSPTLSTSKTAHDLKDDFGLMTTQNDLMSVNEVERDESLYKTEDVTLSKKPHSRHSAEIREEEPISLTQDSCAEAFERASVLPEIGEMLYKQETYLRERVKQEMLDYLMLETNIDALASLQTVEDKDVNTNPQQHSRISDIDAREIAQTSRIFGKQEASFEREAYKDEPKHTDGVGSEKCYPTLALAIKNNEMVKIEATRGLFKRTKSTSFFGQCQAQETLHTKSIADDVRITNETYPMMDETTQLQDASDAARSSVLQEESRSSSEDSTYIADSFEEEEEEEGEGEKKLASSGETFLNAERKMSTQRSLVLDIHDKNPPKSQTQFRIREPQHTSAAFEVWATGSEQDAYSPIEDNIVAD